jgi:hypothetical protein
VTPIAKPVIKRRVVRRPRVSISTGPDELTELSVGPEVSVEPELSVEPPPVESPSRMVAFTRLYLTEDEITKRFLDSPEKTAPEHPLRRPRSILTTVLDRDRSELGVPDLLPVSGMVGIMHVDRELLEKNFGRPSPKPRRSPAHGGQGTALPPVRFV